MGIEENDKKKGGIDRLRESAYFFQCGGIINKKHKKLNI